MTLKKIYSIDVNAVNTVKLYHLKKNDDVTEKNHITVVILLHYLMLGLNKICGSLLLLDPWGSGKSLHLKKRFPLK